MVHPVGREVGGEQPGRPGGEIRQTARPVATPRIGAAGSPRVSSNRPIWTPRNRMPTSAAPVPGDRKSGPSSRARPPQSIPVPAVTLSSPDGGRRNRSLPSSTETP
ncbi:MAG: hypothetical protein L6W00_04595 [Lentisphaeria bacterium]|nr:MAG: hypothetical protein L6W00_04595 [Lentisphaeria bacterium]